MNLPGVTIIGKIDLDAIKTPKQPTSYIYASLEEDIENEGAMEEYWEMEKRRFIKLQELYAKGYTYEEAKYLL